MDTPNQPLTRSEVVGDNVGDTSEDFCQTNKYVKIGWLLLKSLDKTGKENDELRDLNSQLNTT